MKVFTPRKNKIVLSDYPYQRDVESRLLFAHLNSAEAALLNELFNYSLFIPVSDLSATLDLSASAIEDILIKFSSSSLYRYDNGNVILNKALRRYYEGELAKFNQDFEPGMDYLQSLLNKVPPYVLPNWYALPRRCERMFPAIVEKYFANPKVYQRYLKELQFSHPAPGKIAEAVFASPDLKVDASSLQRMLSLSPREFHEWLLLLEFHFVCCLKYEHSEGMWREVVTPYHEWRDYLLFHRKTEASLIADSGNILRTHPRDFGFVEDLTLLLQHLKCRPLKVVRHRTGWTLSEIERQALFPHQTASSYSHALIDKTLFMHFADIRSGQLIFLQPAEDWIPLPLIDKAMTMTRHPIQVEKGLRRVLHGGWIYVEDFIHGFTGGLRSKETIALVNKGKNWKYHLPDYNDEERALIETTLCQRLFEAGIVATGTHCGKACFCVTPFGMSLF